MAQKTEVKINVPVRSPFESYKKSSAENFGTIDEFSTGEIAAARADDALAAANELEETPFNPFKAEIKRQAKENNTDETDIKTRVDDETSSQKKDAEETRDKFHWKPALIESGIFLGIQHGYRMTQAKTRRELGGPFLREWGESVKGLRGWRDSDSFFINYVAHPLQGGLTGRIFVANSDGAKRQEFGKSKDYWTSRFKAMAWSAVWSAQFELGPISEASLGNVGIREKRGHSTMAFVDLVVTPTVGTGVLIGEDAIDKYILKNWVEKNAHRTTVKIRVLRSVLTLTTSVQNMLRGRVPWKRDNRLLN